MSSTLVGRTASKDVEEQLQAELQAIETFLETHGLPVKKDTLTDNSMN